MQKNRINLFLLLFLFVFGRIYVAGKQPIPKNRLLPEEQKEFDQKRISVEIELLKSQFKLNKIQMPDNRKDVLRQEVVQGVFDYLKQFLPEALQEMQGMLDMRVENNCAENNNASGLSKSYITAFATFIETHLYKKELVGLRKHIADYLTTFYRAVEREEDERRRVQEALADLALQEQELELEKKGLALRRKRLQLEHSLVSPSSSNLGGRVSPQPQPHGLQSGSSNSPRGVVSDQPSYPDRLLLQSPSSQSSSNFGSPGSLSSASSDYLPVSRESSDFGECPGSPRLLPPTPRSFPGSQMSVLLPQSSGLQSPFAFESPISRPSSGSGECLGSPRHLPPTPSSPSSFSFGSPNSPRSAVPLQPPVSPASAQDSLEGFQLDSSQDLKNGVVSPRELKIVQLVIGGLQNERPASLSPRPVCQQPIEPQGSPQTGTGASSPSSCSTPTPQRARAFWEEKDQKNQEGGDRGNKKKGDPQKNRWGVALRKVREAPKERSSSETGN